MIRTIFLALAAGLLDCGAMRFTWIPLATLLTGAVAGVFYHGQPGIL